MEKITRKRRGESYIEARDAQGYSKPVCITMTERSRSLIEELTRQTKGTKSGVIREALEELAKKYNLT